jgi:hypothetical protein
MSVPPGTEMFQFPGFASTAYVFSRRYLIEVGCPIRTPRDQRLLAAPPRFSQRATSFFASWRQGIHQMPFSYSKPVIPLAGYDQASHRTHPTQRDGKAIVATARWQSHRRYHRPNGSSRSHTHTFLTPSDHGHSTPTLETSSRITPKTAPRRVALPTPAGATEPDSQSPKNTINPNPRLRSDLEPRSKPNPTKPKPGHGDGRVRTDDPLLAKQVLSQLSYVPREPSPESPRRQASGGSRGTVTAKPRHAPPASRRHLIPPTSDPWAREDLNLRPHAYQACALTN